MLDTTALYCDLRYCLLTKEQFLSRVRDIRAFRIDQWSNFTSVVKS